MSTFGADDDLFTNVYSKKKRSQAVAGVYYTDIKEEKSSNYYTELPDSHLPSDYQIINNSEVGERNEACDGK